MLPALSLILFAVAYRIFAAWHPHMADFSPLMAMTFCGGMYFRNWGLRLAPLIALSASDLYLGHYYASQFGYHWDIPGVIIRSLCFAAALGLGLAVARHRNWLTTCSGVVAGSSLFYLATNTASWFSDLGYSRTMAGWWQAMTIGHPEFPPTLLFFRNSMVSDILFAGLFVFAVEFAWPRLRSPLFRRVTG